MRWRSNQLHRRQRSGGEQNYSKLCHDGLNPRKISWQRMGNQRLTIND
jgi:hypothetical protein